MSREPDTKSAPNAKHDPGHEEMIRAAERAAARRAASRHDRSWWDNLTMIGALGWLIVVPTLIGVAIGRWLDTRYHSGIFWTAALIFVGVSVGCYLAWQRVRRP